MSFLFDGLYKEVFFFLSFRLWLVQLHGDFVHYSLKQILIMGNLILLPPAFVLGG